MARNGGKKLNHTDDVIRVHGARVHNLKNIDVDIPKNKLVVITGVSGSGKSSLAFDTLYAEGQRRYVESLSAYARQFLGVMEKPDVERIDGLSPAISIDQKSVSKNPRSTVGTITEIYDYLRLLFSRIGKPHCPSCNRPVSRQTPSNITSEILKLVAGAERRGTKSRITRKKDAEFLMLAPIIQDRKGEHKAVLQEIQKAGFVKVRFDGVIWNVEELLERAIDKQKKHTLEVVVDRLEAGEKDRSRVAASVETALKMGKGLLKISKRQTANSKRQITNGKQPKAVGSKLKAVSSDLLFSEHFACPHCHINLPPIEPRTFSFNSPYGACPECTGLGSKIVVDPELVIPNKNLTLGEGAIRPWMTASHRVGRQGFYWWMLHELSEKYGFSLNRPVKELSGRIIEIILEGDDDFEGVINNLERRWRETDSEFTRAEIEKYMVIKTCELCRGKRLRKEALAVKIGDCSIADACDAPIKKMDDWITDVSKKLSLNERKIAQLLLREISRRTQFLIEVGLDYLTLSRASTTLAGGEAQRIRLATQIGSGLTGVLYILDEPSVGLHARDQGRLISTLKHLRDMKNSVIVVEHDPQTIGEADWIIDIGPGAGELGGKIIFEGSPQQLMQIDTLTGEYLSGRKVVKIHEKQSSKQEAANYLVINGATEHNLKNIDVKIPLGRFVCIAGVSGSGKSTLVDDILARALLKHFYQARLAPGQHKAIKGVDNLDKAILVDQSPIGRTPRSNPATYTGAFTYIRELFSKTPLARMRGYSPGRFSFNVKGGRCEACEGQGSKKIEMYFLEDIYVECEECKGRRYNPEALEVEWNELNIAEVLGLSVSKALKFFSKIPALADKLRTLEDVGLGYMKLGQPAPTLSGGEAQRVKLATELSRRATGRTLYILDEPTTGLHFDDVQKLLNVLSRLVEMGNTVLVIEHNLDVLKNADWIIELGPEGGENGGAIVGEGTPENLSKNQKSPTGKYLRSLIFGL